MFRPQFGSRLFSNGLSEASRQGPAIALKRAFDITIAGGILLALAPLIALIALAIKLGDGGPVFFIQNRVGQNRVGRGGKLFGCAKFRTMVCGAEHMDGGFVVTADDQRVTRVGRFLRLWTLDEIPQLWNVLRGDMSIVGPRPWVPDQAAHCSPADRRRFDVPPGMAGWAWIHGRNQLDWQERIRLDIWYVDHWSLALDFRILARASVLLFRRDGVYFETPADKFLTELPGADQMSDAADGSPGRQRLGRLLERSSHS